MRNKMGNMNIEDEILLEVLDARKLNHNQQLYIKMSKLYSLKIEQMKKINAPPAILQQFEKKILAYSFVARDLSLVEIDTIG